MKMISVSLIALMGTFGMGSIAVAMSLPEARTATAQVASETNQLIGTCEAIAPAAEKIKFELSTIAAGLNEFTEGTDTVLETALKDIDLGISAVKMSQVECINYQDQPTTNSKSLLEMYLLHVDIDLMILQHEVGTDGNRKK